MEFAVDNLPEGLKVDPKTGQITGSLKERGEYRVVFRAKNAEAECPGEERADHDVVCASTVAEVTAAARAAILVPLIRPASSSDV